jgi:hypothetical protein
MAQNQHLDIDAALKAEQDRLISRKQELETELADINTRLARIHRYYNDEPPQRSRSAPTQHKRAGDRAERGSVQMAVLEIIDQNSGGLTRAEIIAKLPDVQVQSISNALAQLSKSHRVHFPGRGGKYRPITIEPPGETTTPE